MNELQRIFTFDEAGDEPIPLRVDYDDEGEALLSGADLARACGITQPDKALARVSDEYKVTRISNTGGPDRIFLREPGVYQFLATVRMRKNPKYAKFMARITLFRKWLFEKVLPTIRRTGRYLATREDSVPAVPEKPKAPAIEPEFCAWKRIALECGFDANIAVLKASNIIRDDYGIDIAGRLQLALPSPENERYEIPTDLGKGLNATAVAVNQTLMELGFQYKNPAGHWVLTDEGQKYGRYFDCNYKHSTYSQAQQIRWSTAVLPLLRERLAPMMAMFD